jgi:hypothetical protein
VTPHNLYEWMILVALIAAMFHLAVVIGYRNRRAPWWAKAIYATGQVALLSWIYVRVVESLAPGWWGIVVVGCYIVGTMCMVIAYRRAPYEPAHKSDYGRTATTDG